ncbi:MAG: FtsX-like permease family protein [Phycisphaeraceae bacterium]|nr:FtsX-like permease family protein [Phycisphaeraceae bacterium]
MRAVWHLAIRTLSARRWRSAMLVAAVGLSAALIAAVSCALASAHAAVNAQINQSVGDADVRLTASSSGTNFPSRYLDQVRAWPEVAEARAELTSTLSLAVEKDGLAEGESGDWVRTTRLLRATVLVHGVWFSQGGARVDLIAGRMPTDRGEVVLDALTAERLSWLGHGTGVFSSNRKTLSGNATHLTMPEPVVPELANPSRAETINAAIGVRPGDTIRVVRLFRAPEELRVVGIAAAPPLGGRPQAWFSMPDLAALSGAGERLSQIEMVLRPGVDADAFVAERQAELGERFLLQTTARVRAGVEKNVASSQLAFALATVMCFLSASFIIMTGLNTGLAEQQRSLAVLRCIGARPRQLAMVQILTGLLVGVLGALVGVPLGVGIAWGLIEIFKDTVQTGLVLSPMTLSVAALGAVASGILGALWPAWQATRASPLAALALRAMPVRARHVQATLAVALACIGLQLLIVGVPDDGQFIFWMYATFGLPVMFIGYFLLGVPLVVLIARGLSPLLSRLLGLPASLLGRTIAATPYRYGLTAGALMAGIALMVGLYTNAGGFLNDWINRIRFPDAFVSGVALSPESQRLLNELPFVTDTCAISLVPVATEAFGVRALQSYKTTFVAFEPEPFFRMTELEWVEGEAASAKRRLAEGGAVMVAREFRVAKGLGVGDTFRCTLNDIEHEFEIVGVVTSPGLEMVSKFFNVGDEYVDQTLHAVFGSRADMIEKFGTDAIGLIQMSFAPGTDDEAALSQIRERLFGAGIIDAGSGRQIREAMVEIVRNAVRVFTVVAGLSMFIASFGVASVIAAGVHARRFELGVLRAVGAQRALLARLIVGEAIIIALSAWVLGSVLGLQGAWAGRRLDALLLGIRISGEAPWGALAGALGAALLFTLGASLPTVVRLTATSPRDLLSARLG